MTRIKAFLIAGMIMGGVPAQANSDAAQQAFQAKDYSQATRLFEKQLEQNENNVFAYLYLAKIAVKNEDLDLAEEHILEAVDLIEDKPAQAPDKSIQAEIFHWLGSIMETQAEKSSIFSMSGYAKKSLKVYVKSVELLPEKLEYREGLINFYLGAPSLLGGDIDEAIKHAKVTFDQNPNFGYKMLINSYEKNGDTQLVLATYKRAIEKYPLDAELLFMRGTYWKNERNYDKAVADYQLALTLPDTVNDQKSAQLLSLYWIGRISGFEGKNLKRGIDAYQQVIDFSETSGDDTYTPNIEWTKFRMAQLLILNGQNKEANAIFVNLLNSTQREDLKKELSSVMAQ
jgi:tetratricopeptide (TPR) repeat protein